jgi:hypothetical protein
MCECLAALVILCIASEETRSLHGAAEGQGSASHSTHLEVASIALPVFLRRCRGILIACAQQYVAEPPSSGLPVCPSRAPLASNSVAPEAPLTADNRILWSPKPGHEVLKTVDSFAAADPATASSPAATAIEPSSPQQPEAGLEMHLTKSQTATEAVSPASNARTGRIACSTCTGAIVTFKDQHTGRETAVADAGLAVLALQLLLQLQLQREVIDRALPERKRLGRLIRCVRAAQDTAAESLGKDPVGHEQTHLLLMHACVLRCVSMPNASVCAAALAVLCATGEMLGLAQEF